VFGQLDLRSLKRFAITIGIAAAGGAAAELLGLPAGWLSGGLLVVAAASLAGVNTDVPASVRTPAYFVLGIYAGSGVSQETLHQMQTWPASFLVLSVSLVILIAGAYRHLHRRHGWDRNAALLSALPGALSFVLAAAEQLRTDMKKVAVAQSVRLVMLVELVPLIGLLLGHSGELAGGAEQPSHVGLVDLALLLGAGLAAALLFLVVRLPGAWMLGGLFASAALLLSGVVEGRLPPLLVIPCTIALAAIAGSRFRPGDMAILPRLLRPALGAFAIASCVSAAAAAIVAFLFEINFLQALLAFSPGAQEAVVILAYAMNLDPAYVAAHQVVRFLALVALVPILTRWLNRHP